MGLRETIQNAVQSGMNAMGNIQESVTYTAVSETAYNTTTGAMTVTKQTYAAVKAVFDQYSRKEMDGDAIRPEDQKVLIAKKNLTPIPGLNDTITRADATVWSVISVQTDPVNAHWQLQVRRP